MAASTITRATWTNDTGTPATPVGDGTVINNTRLQNDIYAKIDEMFAGAGSYATFTLGGKLAVEGFGTHTFSAGGVGANILRVANTTAGTSNSARVDVQTDSGVLGIYQATSSTNVSEFAALAVNLRAISAATGGLNLSAENASGVIRFFSGGPSERARFSAAGCLLIGDTTNADVTLGMTINQAGNDDQILAFKSSDIAHALGVVETDTYGAFGKTNNGLGGLSIKSYAEALGTTANGMQFLSDSATGSGDTTKSGSGNAYYDFRAYESSAQVGANENLVVFRNGNQTMFILDADGDSHQDVGTAWTNFDDHEDAELLTALSAGVSRKGDPLRRAFGSLLKKHKATLERNGIVTFNADGHHFVNWSRLNMLKVGAIRQNAMRIAALERRLTALEA